MSQGTQGKSNRKGKHGDMEVPGGQPGPGESRSPLVGVDTTGGADRSSHEAEDVGREQGDHQVMGTRGRINTRNSLKLLETF